MNWNWASYWVLPGTVHRHDGGLTLTHPLKVGEVRRECTFDGPGLNCRRFGEPSDWIPPEGREERWQYLSTQHGRLELDEEVGCAMSVSTINGGPLLSLAIAGPDGDYLHISAAPRGGTPDRPSEGPLSVSIAPRASCDTTWGARCPTVFPDPPEEDLGFAHCEGLGDLQWQ